MIQKCHRFVFALLLLTPFALAAAVVPASLSAADSALQQQTLFFEQQIRPLLISRCYSCHSVKAGKSEGGLLLDSRKGCVDGGDSGPAVVPESLDESLLIRAVRGSDGDWQMPPDRPLSEREISLLEQWIRMGAPDPRDAPQSDRQWVDDPSDPIAGREHWAFRPLNHSSPFQNAPTDWPRSTIDRYVEASRRAAGLVPAPDADRPTLARRLFVQLTGLPPTHDQIRDFEHDPRPDALERLVDQLLGSSAFGEQWGRHWLDLARYADSNGLDENFLFREAWRYRNQVIDAFNQDTPLDQFLTEQIAGDLLPYQTIEQRDRQRIAAGFMVIGPKVLLGNDDNQRIMDVADEQIDTIGRAVLGQTLGCARCHDHKFDPVPTADYYALAGIMTSTQVMETRHMLGQQRLMEQLVGIGERGTAIDEAYETYWRERPKFQSRVKQAQAALELLKNDDLDKLREHAAQHEGSVSPDALAAEKTLQERIEDQQRLVIELAKHVDPAPPIPPRAMVPSDLPAPSDEHIRLAGQHDRLGDQVPRGFLRVLSNGDAPLPVAASGRLELAQWLTDTERGAGYLTARVFANRLWYHLTGRGIVRTVDNFGRTGELPSHPELLDYLAYRLIQSGWSLKTLIREIVTSRTFAISSRHEQEAHVIDPENRWLWRANRRRLTPEAFRDAMLVSADALDLAQMESSVWYLGDQATAVGANKNRRRTDFPCRSVYLPIVRNDLPELFDAFDFADPHAATGMRPDTMVPNQGLFVLNDDSVMVAAEATAKRLLATQSSSVPGRDDETLLEELFLRVFGRAPEDQQRHVLLRFIQGTRNQLKSEGNADTEVQTWSQVCHALFATSRFQILE